MVKTSTPAADLEMFDFLIGDWKGKSRPEPIVQDIVMTCLKSPDGSGVEIIQADEDRKSGKTFYAEHLSIVPGAKPGAMDVTRSGFAYADVGDKLFVMHETVRREGTGVRFSPKAGSKNFLQNNLTMTKEGENGLKVKGTASAGGDPWSFEFHLKRITPRRKG